MKLSLVPFSKRYEHIGLVGKGGQGRVHLCRCRYAERALRIAKVAHADRVSRRSIASEAGILERLRGRASVPTLRSLLYLGADLVGFMKDCIPGETLDERLRRGRLFGNDIAVYNVKDTRVYPTRHRTCPSRGCTGPPN